MNEVLEDQTVDSQVDCCTEAEQERSKLKNVPKLRIGTAPVTGPTEETFETEIRLESM